MQDQGTKYCLSLLVQEILSQRPETWNDNINIHSIGVCRMRRFLAFRWSFFRSSLLRTFSRHPSPPTILPSSLTSSCHLFLGLPLNLVVTKFIYNTLLGILFSFFLPFSVHAQTNEIYLTLLSLL